MQEEFEPINEHTSKDRNIVERLRKRLAESRRNRVHPTSLKSEPILHPQKEPALEPEPASASEPEPASASESEPKAVSIESGWNQGDGRRADNLVLYEQRIPESIRRRIEPVKGTHFRFRNLSEETAFLEAIVGSEPYRAVYQPKGKRDVILTGTNGELMGHIHLLHVNAPDIQYPEKYYVKFYLFDFKDAGTLQTVKQNILSFFQTRGTSPASRSRVARSRVTPAFRSKTRRRPHRFRPRHRGSKLKIEGTSKRTQKVFRRR
jgi:hypothetical protein